MWYLLLLPLCLALHDREPAAPDVISRNDDVSIGWLDVRLTHFHAANTDTFPMRFFYNGAFAKNDPHIVIFVGGEWEITPGWVQGGLPYQLAQEIGAGLFYTEHRFYGQTRPSSASDVSSLRWLTVDQALGDLAQFIHYIKSDAFENGIYKNGKVILIGCSYAGSMATWMRLSYPHLVDAAYSDSGPLHAQEDFPEYLEMITTALRVQGSAACVDSIHQAMTAILELLDSSPETVSRLFNTCSPIDASSPLDRATFFWLGITETLAYLVQYALPGQIYAACTRITDPTETDPVVRFANWITEHAWTQPCIESRYQQFVADHRNTSFDSQDSAMRAWTYQTCVEYGWYQTTTGSEHPFLDVIPLEYFHQMCRDLFSAVLDVNLLQSGIERTNLFFAGWDQLPDYVVSVAGGHDPWAPMGPNTTHAHPLAPVYVVPETSHCRALGAVSPTDDSELDLTKIRVLNHLSLWSTGYEMFRSAASGVLASFGLIAAAVFVVAF